MLALTLDNLSCTRKTFIDSEFMAPRQLFGAKIMLGACSSAANLVTKCTASASPNAL